MPSPIQRYLTIISSIVLLLLAGCGSAPALTSKSEVVPAGVDLSGHWHIRGESGAMRMPKSRDTGIRSIPIGRQSRDRPERRSAGMSVQVFLEYGDALKITQTEHGLFISYDRSVVREYTFGENRLINVGPIEALRVSGWEGNTFVVETLDNDGTTLYEYWGLDSAGEVLVRDIRLSKGEHEKFSLTQLFDRQ